VPLRDLAFFKWGGQTITQKNRMAGIRFVKFGGMIIIAFNYLVTHFPIAVNSAKYHTVSTSILLIATVRNYL
jgi:hypothetical protein